MHAYRFRVLIDEDDEFIREIDVLANQSFDVFHQTLQSTLGFDGSELASFFICDHRWKKLSEITLLDMQSEETFDNEDEDFPKRKKPLPLQVMSRVQVRDVINDPHQHILYQYDFLNPKLFFIELTKILEATADIVYPLVVKSNGNAPWKNLAVPPITFHDQIENELVYDDDFHEEDFEIENDDIVNEDSQTWQQ